MKKHSLVFWALLIIGIVTHHGCSYLPEEQIVSDVLSVYESRDYIELSPNWDKISNTGFVFYPGGLVDPHAYVESLSRFVVSGIGHKVIIAKMPGNLAVLDSKQGAYMFEDFPGVKRWVIGGHSLGGVMACSAVEKYPDYFVGLVLMAAYPQENINLSEWSGAVLSLKGEFDKILDTQIIDSRKGNLPPSAIYETIPGGNHSQFGKYGHQEGDGMASISFEEQTGSTVKFIQELYNYNGWN